jgi:hypothetical protein
MSRENVEIVQRAYDLWNDGDDRGCEADVCAGRDDVDAA